MHIVSGTITKRMGPRRSRNLQIDEWGHLEQVCRKGGGGGTRTEYVQSPEERAIMQRLLPVIEWIFPGNTYNTSREWVPYGNGNGSSGQGLLNGSGITDWLDSHGIDYQMNAQNGGAGGYWREIKTPTGDRPVNLDLYPIPDLNIDLPEMGKPADMQLPDIMDYVAGSRQFQNVYDKIAPSFWNSYESGVQNPLIDRFAGSGSLGSPLAGLSGASATALEEARRKAGMDISAQAFGQAQTPLMAGYQGALQKGMTEFGADQSRVLAEYGAGTNAAMERGLRPWEATLQMYQYPFQILPGLLGGTMPQPVTTSSGGGKK